MALLTLDFSPLNQPTFLRSTKRLDGFIVLGAPTLSTRCPSLSSTSWSSEVDSVCLTLARHPGNIQHHLLLSHSVRVAQMAHFVAGVDTQLSTRLSTDWGTFSTRQTNPPKVGRNSTFRRARQVLPPRLFTPDNVAEFAPPPVLT